MLKTVIVALSYLLLRLCRPSEAEGTFDSNDECMTLEVCKNGGTCSYGPGGFKCICMGGWTGADCSENIDDCLGEPCHKGGTCVDMVGYFRCECPIGVTGIRCHLYDACESQPCHAGGVCETVFTDGSYRCNCPTGWAGEQCTVDNNECLQGLRSPCENGMCVNTPGSYHCDCAAGFTGSRCDKDIDECASNPCPQDATCLDWKGRYSCICMDGKKGVHCDMFDDTFPVGIGHPIMKPTTILTLEDQQELLCKINRCGEKVGNGQCDRDCNTYACSFDNMECSLNIQPWQDCSAIKQGIYCYNLFRNGICDEACDSEDCLFDGYDCGPQVNECSPIYDKYCIDHYANSHCDKVCDTAECNWDGGDCNLRDQYAEGFLIFILLVSQPEFSNISVQFLRDIGNILHIIVEIAHEVNGNQMVYPYSAVANNLLASTETEGQQIQAGHRSKRAFDRTKVYTRINNQNCNVDGIHCIKSAHTAAQFLAAEASEGRTPKTLLSVSALDEKLVTEGKWPVIYTILGVISLVVIVVTLLSVLISRKQRGTTWFPSQVTQSSDRDGQECKVSDGSDGTGEKETNCSGRCRGRQSPDQSEPEGDNQQLDFVQPDSRQWTQRHLVAAILQHPLHTEATQQSDNNVELGDVNAKGPDGLTPLMVASFCGDGSQECTELSDMRSVAMTTLLAQGANMNTKTDTYGETSLHLAARYDRPDAAQCLMDAGADPNVQDKTGRTPLHAAVASDSPRVLSILLKSPNIRIAQTHDGTTPLILAARLAVNNLVEPLLDAGADVNISDNKGKTALHWACAVNNAEAAQVLLEHGAERDIKDDKDETPLFTAAREGSFQAAKVLLHYLADSEIPYNNGCLPRDLAREKKHYDILKLLDEYCINKPNLWEQKIGHHKREAEESKGKGTKQIKAKKKRLLQNEHPIPTIQKQKKATKRKAVPSESASSLSREWMGGGLCQFDKMIRDQVPYHPSLVNDYRYLGPELPSHTNEYTHLRPELPSHTNGYKYLGPELPSHTNEYTHLRPELPSHTNDHKYLRPELPPHTNDYKYLGPELPSHTNEYTHLSPELPSHTNNYKYLGPELPSHTKGYKFLAHELPYHTNGYKYLAHELPSHTNNYKYLAHELPSHTNGYKYLSPKPLSQTDDYEYLSPKPLSQTDDYEYLTPKPLSNVNYEYLAPKPLCHTDNYEYLFPKPLSHSDDYEYLSPKPLSRVNNYEYLSPKPLCHSSNCEYLSPKPLSHVNNYEYLNPKPLCHSDNTEYLSPKPLSHVNNYEYLTPKPLSHAEDYECLTSASKNYNYRTPQLPAQLSGHEIQQRPQPPSQVNNFEATSSSAC